MLLSRLIRYGITIFLLFFSIVMEFSDDGDLYQKIVSHQKAGTYF